VTSTAYKSLSSTTCPISHTTYLPNKDLNAGLGHYLATLDYSVGDSGSSYKSAIARAKATKPAADNASLVALGKLFAEMMQTQYSQLRRLASSRFFLKTLSRWKQAVVRAPEMSGVKLYS